MIEYEHPPCVLEDVFGIDAFYSCFEHTFFKGYRFGGERHDFWECVMSVEGTIEITAEERVFRIVPGQIVFHKPMEFHRMAAVDDRGYTTRIFTFGALGEAMQFFEGKCIEISQEHKKYLSRIFNEGEQVFKDFWPRERQLDRLSLSAMRAQLELLLISMLRGSKSVDMENPSRSAALYRDIIIYLKEHINASLSMEQIAKANRISVSSLKAIFKRYSGEGVMGYFANMKIERAKELIQEGKSIGEVSMLLSYSCQNYFTEAFKRECGMTPSEYRKYIMAAEIGR